MVKPRSCVVAVLVAVLATEVLSGTRAAQQTEWAHHMGTAKDEGVAAVVRDGSGSIYVVGSTESNLYGASSGGMDVFVVKYNSSGTQAWAHQYGTSKDDCACGAAIDTSGNLYIAGSTDGIWSGNAGRGRSDGYLLKLSPAGAVTWVRQFGTTGSDDACGVSVDSQGFVFVGGGAGGLLFGSTFVEGDLMDAYVAKYSGDGSLQWGKQFGVAGLDWVDSLTISGSGNVIVGGATEKFVNSASESVDGLLMKLDASGAVVWKRQFGDGSLGDRVSSLAVNGAGDVYLALSTDGDDESCDESTRAPEKSSIIKFSAGGKRVWQTPVGSAGGAQLYGLALDKQGCPVVVGSVTGGIFGTSAGGQDGVFAKFDAAGRKVYGVQFGTSGDEWAEALAVDSSGSVIVAGSSSGSLYGSNAGMDDVFVAKFRFLGP